MTDACKHTGAYVVWYTTALGQAGVTAHRKCADCGAMLKEPAKNPARPLKKGDWVRVKGEAALFGEIADVERFTETYRRNKDLVHEDGSPILWPDEDPAQSPPSKPAWKVWRDTMARKGECPCGIPEGVCGYHKKSA